MPRALWRYILLAPALVGCSAVENRLVFQPTRLPPERFVPAPSWCKDIDLRTADGTLIHARWCPHPQATGAVLYCHGNAGELTGRGREIHDIWSNLGKSVLIFDYPGYGRSEGTPSEAGCYAAAQAAYDWLTKTQNVRGEQVILFGESLGGGVATELATRVPHHALVLCRTFTSMPEVAQAKLSLFSSTTALANRFDNLTKLPRCPRPVFVAVADNDEVIPASHARRLIQACPPNSNLFVIVNARHNDPLGAECFETMRQFLAANPALPTPAAAAPAATMQ